MQLVKYEAARQALAEANAVDEVKDISDKVEALRAYAKQKNDTEMELWLSEIKVRADRRIGEISSNLDKIEPVDSGAMKNGGVPASGKTSKKETLKQAGISISAANRCEQIAGIPEEEFEEEIETAKETEKPITSTVLLRKEKEKRRELKRDENREKIEQAAKPEEILGCYSTIVIDPPWDWGDEGDQDQLGRARPTYQTMSIDELKEMPVGDYADDNCHIYLWITNRSLPKGFDLLDSWGFRYVTCVTWVKPHFGMGNYFRGQTEHVLFGVKGSQPLKRKDAGTVFEAPRGPNGHSSKPVEFYSLVESCSPGPYLEMFARSDRKDWTAWGAEANAA